MNVYSVLGDRSLCTTKNTRKPDSVDEEFSQLNSPQLHDSPLSCTGISRRISSFYLFLIHLLPFWIDCPKLSISNDETGILKPEENLATHSEK